MTLLTVDTLAKTYGGIRALDRVSLEVAEGEFVTLLGPSGSGKTTLLMSVAGFTAPSSGRILMEGEDITARDPEDRDFGFVFQGYALFPHLSVAENIAFPLRVRKWSRARIAARVGEMLALTGLEQLAGRRPAALSGGQQQRVALARGQRPDPGGAGAADVDRHAEGVLVMLGGQLAPGAGGLLEADRGTLGQQHGFQHDEVAGIGSLAHRHHVGLGHRAEIALGQPEPGPGMVLGEEHRRIQPGRFVAGGEEQRAVEAGRQPLGPDAPRIADLLAAGLEGGRGHGIAQPQSGQSRPDRACQHPDPARVLRLVAVDRAVMPGGLEKAGGLLQHRGDCGIVRRDMGRQQMRHLAETAPFVARQHFDLDRGAGKLVLALRGGDGKLAQLGLVQPAEQRRIERGVELRQRQRGARCQPVDGPGLGADQAGAAIRGDGQPFERDRPGIAQRDPAQDRHAVLGGGRIDPRHRVHRDLKGGPGRSARRFEQDVPHVPNSPRTDGP
ncbi:ABC transporter ATP-binding protein [Mangrovicoccus ximenensis]|uniref:ABC transporter ATP-binding protein n=1 Tax=Mangrovicoccus ximenensis TaxID=1911570 RepID=UPI000D37779D|nr:ABC transporter ATP-binding protein [Mangrovicoccus ximenensis]